MKTNGTDTNTLEDSVPSERLLSEARPTYFCLVLECDRPASGGARYSLTGIDEVRVGRGRERGGSRRVENGRRLLDIRVPGGSMSASHARLTRGEEGWILEDASSTNGSFVNGRRVERSVLRESDVADLGHTLFCVRSAVPSAIPELDDLDSVELASRPPGFSTLAPHARKSLYDLARVAASSLPVLLLGETGTGKEVVARSVHELSRRVGPFVAVNCGALASNLVESLLFGHVKGAFSGAISAEPGAFRAAEAGTILLDEIGDLPGAAQPTLLRLLQEREVTPVGSARPVPVDVRVIAATHRPLVELAKAGEFRADLLARLSGFVHPLPALRNRREDIGVIVASILAKHGMHERGITITPAAGRLLIAHDWPANIRELESAMVRALMLADGGRLDADHFALQSNSVTGQTFESQAENAVRPLSEADAELRRQLSAQLELHRGNVTDVTRALGTTRMQIYRWLKRLDLDIDRFRR